MKGVRMWTDLRWWMCIYPSICFGYSRFLIRLHAGRTAWDLPCDRPVEEDDTESFMYRGFSWPVHRKLAAAITLHDDPRSFELPEDPAFREYMLTYMRRYHPDRVEGSVVNLDAYKKKQEEV